MENNFDFLVESAIDNAVKKLGDVSNFVLAFTDEEKLDWITAVFAVLLSKHILSKKDFIEEGLVYIKNWAKGDPSSRIAGLLILDNTLSVLTTYLQGPEAAMHVLKSRLSYSSALHNAGIEKEEHTPEEIDKLVTHITGLKPVEFMGVSKDEGTAL